MDKLSSAIYEYISTIVPKENILLNEPMSKHITFRVGGEAKALVKVQSAEQIRTLIDYLKKIQEPYYVKGNGSNLLVGDKGYNGVIIEIGSEFADVTIEGDVICAKAGALMSTIARKALDNGLGGFEFASGIPGSIGGGVVMNAGAYGGELKDCVQKVTVLSSEGEILTLNNSELGFGYRTSIFKTRPFIVLEVEIRLTPADKKDIEEKMHSLAEQRKAKQPLEFPSAGSTFKRPEGYYAGKLIMDAGLRGFTIGGASVSEKHCGFVINRYNASAEDVYEVIVEVQERVHDKFGVNLEPEIIFLGTF